MGNLIVFLSSMEMKSRFIDKGIDDKERERFTARLKGPVSQIVLQKLI